MNKEELAPAGLSEAPDETLQTLNVGGDQVTLVTAELPENQKEAIRWLYSLAQAQRWSLSRLARETQIDSSTLFRVFNGKYEAKLDRITERVEKYRDRFEDRAQRSRETFVEISISKKIWEACDWARQSKTMVFVYGNTQFGKTTAALEYMARHNHGITKYVRLPASAGVQLMMKEFARSCWVSPNSCFENLREYVLNAIDSSHLILIDELHQVFLSYLRGSAIKCLEVIREIHDRRGCGMVLFGTNKLKKELMMGEHVDLLTQFKERGVLEVQLPTTVPRKDLSKIAASFGLAEPPSDAAEIIERITKDHGLKRYVLFLKSGKILAGSESRRMTWDYFIRAHDIIAKLGAEHHGKNGALK
jgi:DNA transposition AAA+ family ATPase